MSTMPRRPGEGPRPYSPRDVFEVGLSVPSLLRSPLDVAKAVAARTLGLPKPGSLIGGAYARFMAENAPSAVEALKKAVMGQRPEVKAAGASDSAPAPTAPPVAPHRPQATRAVASPPKGVVKPDERTASAPMSDDPDTLEALRAILSTEEGDVARVYKDSLGYLTVGIGHKVLPSDNLKQGEVVPDERRADFFQQDGAKALRAAQAQAAAAGISDPDFILRLASVNFQLGDGWTKEHKKTWRLIREGDYAAAAEEAARSKWNQQTPTRVRKLQEALRRLPPKDVQK